MTKFWEGLGGKLADQWVTTILTPAFAFWLGGFIVWVIHTGLDPLKTLEMQLNQLTPIAQGAVLVGGLLVVVVSSSAIQRLDLTTLRWLEGYWPGWLNWLRNKLARWQHNVMRTKQKRFDDLEAKYAQKSISPDERRERVSLGLELRLAPELSKEYMPTKLGNILRAAENRPSERYGLVTTICWPRLWLILPDATKQELTDARATLDTAARTFLWSLLFLSWTIWAWWVPLVTLVFALWAYRWALSAAEVYGDLLEAAFDLHRFELYEALRFPPPQDTWTELERGNQLTAYLLYGLVAEPVIFQKQKDIKQEKQIEPEEKEGESNSNKGTAPNQP